MGHLEKGPLLPKRVPWYIAAVNIIKSMALSSAIFSDVALDDVFSDAFLDGLGVPAPVTTAYTLHAGP